MEERRWVVVHTLRDGSKEFLCAGGLSLPNRGRARVFRSRGQAEIAAAERMRVGAYTSVDIVCTAKGE